MDATLNQSDLSITRGQIPPDAPPAPVRKRNWGRTIRRVLGWGSLGLFFFLLFAWIALPTKAIAWRIGHEAKKAGYVVEVEDVSVMPWGTVTLEEVLWTYEPSRPDTPPQQYYMEEVDISISLLSLLAGTVDVEVETEREEGTIYARYVQGSSDTTVEVNIDGLPLDDVPKAAQALNVPMEGLLNLKADITAPGGKFAKAEGLITIACSACRAGDGDSKLYVPGGSKALQDGLTVPEVDFGTLTGQLKVEKGTAKIEEPIATESEDLNMSLTGRLKLKDPFQTSRFKMLLKLELTEAFLKRSERVALMYRGASAKAKLDPPERGLGFRLEGPVSRPKFRGVKTKSTAETLAERRKKRRAKDRKRASRRKKTKKKTPAKKTDDKSKDDKDDKDDDKSKDDDAPNLNIKPLDDDKAEGRDEGDDKRPALPPPEDDDVEVFDPNNAPAGEGEGGEGGAVDDGQGDEAQGDEAQGDEAQGDEGGQGDDGQGDGGQGQGDGGNQGGSGGQQQ
ncbi:MAG: type II secretion system protein GspN [Myxococcota bacterium]